MNDEPEVATGVSSATRALDSDSPANVTKETREGIWRFLTSSHDVESYEKIMCEQPRQVWLDGRNIVRRLGV